MKPVIAAFWLMAAAPLAAQPVQPVPVPIEGTMLTVQARGDAQREPDIARISAGVVTEGQTAGEAMSQNRERMERVIAAIRRAGVERKDIQTSNLSLNPQYRYQENQPPRITGYQVQNMVSVKMRDIAEAGKVLDALVSVGANQIQGPNFDIEDRETALDTARRDAMQKARARADLYAAASGMRVARIVAISEGGGFQPPRPMPVMRSMAVNESAADTPIEPGQLDLGITVSVVYELR